MTVIVILKDGTKHVHTLIDKFSTYDFFSFSEGIKKQFQLYGYNFNKYYEIKDISDIKFDFNAN